MSLSKKHRRKQSKLNKQKITFKTTGKVSPGEFHKKKSDAENRIVIEETERFLGEGAHGNVYSAKIYEDLGGVVPYAVKMPPPYYDFNQKSNVVRLWYERIHEMRELGIKSVVDHAEILKGKEDRIFLTDLRMYGQVLDFNHNMDLSLVLNFKEVLLGISEDMAKIHSNNYILSDNGGTYGFRAWFLLRSLTREGYMGERVICDVGGIETGPPNFKFKGDQSEENFNRLMNNYVKLNILSLFAITNFDKDISLDLCHKYIENVSDENIKKIAQEVLFKLDNNLFELKNHYYNVFNES
jgi:hypothetical protein